MRRKERGEHRRGVHQQADQITGPGLAPALAWQQHAPACAVRGANRGHREDADGDALKADFWKESQGHGVSKGDFDRVVFICAKDRLENWIEFLLTGKTDETEEGPRVKSGRDVAVAAKKLADLCKPGKPVDGMPPSLQPPPPLPRATARSRRRAWKVRRLMGRRPMPPNLRKACTCPPATALVVSDFDRRVLPSAGREPPLVVVRFPGRCIPVRSGDGRRSHPGRPWRLRVRATGLRWLRSNPASA